MNCLAYKTAPTMAQARPAASARRAVAVVRCSQGSTQEAAVTRRQAFAVGSAVAMGLLASRPAHAAFEPTASDEMMRRKEERMRQLRESVAKQKAAAGPSPSSAAPDQEAPSA